MSQRSTSSRPRASAESRAASGPTYTCARCGASVRWREVKFCLDRRARFGGRVYCLGCQPEFQAA